MNEVSRDFFLGKIRTLGYSSFDSILLKMFVAFCLSVIIYQLYLLATKQKSKEIKYIILLAAPIITMILLGIGSSIPRAFGLFAALSIIRFRAPIKSTKDMSFIFLSVGVGICCGAGAFLVAIAATLMIVFYTMIIIYLERRKSDEDQFGLNLVLDNMMSENLENSLKSLFPAASLNSKKINSQYFYYMSYKGDSNSRVELEKNLANFDSEINSYDISKEVGFDQI